MFTNNRQALRARQRGLSLIELVLFIVIVGIALGGVLMVMNLNARHSADPLIQKQALAIAEALLEEIEMMPFTNCDPDGFDPSDGSCAKLEAMGPEDAYSKQSQKEGRGSDVAPFDNVNDYSGFQLTGGQLDLANATNVVVPEGYAASVTVTQQAGFGPAGAQIAVAAAVLRIAVTVTYDGGSIVLEGYRTRYAP
ncbi:type II secretion system protein [Noviherbaspirillum cavernae]|uniref:Type II secretion system protein n=1 Tax=Noviherbaspirillum cavernae TaxID=2320862 RepID=A0A418X1R4_9BURK|nr:prepilin-type N-terminal cleavage/methylation domain-containing protein [Noviherbaspirillum cavernae]RJG06402.1 type II secretion system protein [Noviherbaspirillum cavernae]